MLCYKGTDGQRPACFACMAPYRTPISLVPSRTSCGTFPTGCSRFKTQCTKILCVDPSALKTNVLMVNRRHPTTYSETITTTLTISRTLPQQRSWQHLYTAYPYWPAGTHTSPLQRSRVLHSLRQTRHRKTPSSRSIRRPLAQNLHLPPPRPLQLSRAPRRPHPQLRLPVSPHPHSLIRTELGTLRLTAS